MVQSRPLTVLILLHLSKNSALTELRVEVEKASPGLQECYQLSIVCCFLLPAKGLGEVAHGFELCDEQFSLGTH